MAGNTCAASIQGCAMRVARLAADGSTPAGASNMYVTDQMVTLVAERETEAGEEIVVKNACGSNVVDVRDPDRTRRLNLTLGLAIPDPELLELMAGAVLSTTTGTSDGFGYPLLNTIPNQDGVSIEVFSKAIINGSLAATSPYWRWVLPKTYGWVFGSRTWANAAMTETLTGFGIQNSNFGNGPTNDWTGPADRVLAAKRAAALPAVACGYTATPAQV